MDEPRFRAVEGGRPDEEDKILKDLDALVEESTATGERFPKGNELMARLTNRDEAAKYVRFVMRKIAGTFGQAQEQWTRALMILFTFIPDVAGTQIALASIKEDPATFEKPAIRAALRQWMQHLSEQN